MSTESFFEKIEFYRNASLLQENAREMVESQIMQAKHQKKTIACILFDLDHFFPFAELQGPEVTEGILLSCLTLLRQMIEADQVVSYGRDEFLVVIPDKGIDEVVFLAEAMRKHLAERLLEAFSNSKIDFSPQLGCSGGVAIYPDHATEAAALMSKVEEALYRAKRQGRNLVKLPSSESMILKSNYYSNVQLERLGILARKTGRTEASLLREALDRFLKRYYT